MPERTTPVKFSGSSIMSVSPLNLVSGRHPVSEEMAGIVINQNGKQSGKILISDEPIWQTFRLPATYPRGEIVPKLCGFQLNVQVEFERDNIAGFDWIINHFQESFKGWLPIASGTAVGSPGDGGVWINVPFGPIDISNVWWHRFRLGIIGRKKLETPIYREPASYDQTNNLITIGDQVLPVIPTISSAPLVDGKKYPIKFQERPGVLEVIDGDTYYSDQQGIEGIYYTAPNPFIRQSGTEYITINPLADEIRVQEELEEIEGDLHAIQKSPVEKDSFPRAVEPDIKAYQTDGVNPQLINAEEVSIRFRILATASDVDHDCTNSLYRTIASISNPESVRASVGELEDAYWLSAPNPSKFACEALYLDARDGGGNAQVIDHLIVDPVTPGIYMNVYYSNDPAPGVDTETWDGLLWTRVDKQFLLRRRESFAMPEPITAKYLKLEFTHLQPVWYAPGTFRLPTQYRKHPKWVMDFYLSLYQRQRSQEIEAASTVNVEFDALELAYAYYLDDIRQDAPNPPATVISSEGVSLLTTALSKEQKSEENRVDSQTLQKIRLSMQPFRNQPGQQGNFGSLLQRIVGSTTQFGNYPIETAPLTGANTTQVSSLERDSLIVEKQFPVTSFYLTCRHYYMISEANFENDRAYFAGIKEVSATREHYEVRFDTPLYIESAGDEENVLSNDLDTVDHTWVTFNETE